jgi:hypothetical protein
VGGGDAGDVGALPVPEDREQHSQDEDGGDDEQVVADYLIEADGGGDLGTTGRAEQQRRDDAGCRAICQDTRSAA